MYKLSTIALLISILFISCRVDNSNRKQARETERIMQEATKQLGMPAIVNFQEKKNLKWIYELCDQEDLVCHAYLFNEREGKIGQYLGECIGYGVPYSTQFSNPETYHYNGTTLPQAEPNGLFKPEGMSATWLIMLDSTGKQRPVYIEPAIIVSPFKLKN